ncbi:MAG: ABC transporter substrate-binding protein [Flavobacteriales bacterium]|nr:ABC transporter substrate-binding protein [Flavobacteriales bacterium]
MNRWLLWVLILTLWSCSGHQEKAAQGQMHTPIPLEYARGFELFSTGDGYYVVLYNLESDEREILTTIQVGGDTPDSSHAAIHLAHAAQRLACLSTTHIALLQACGSLDRLIATAFAEYVRNPEARAMIESGALRNLSGSEDVDTELLIDLSPDAFLVYPFGNEDYSVYDQYHIPCIPISEYLEEHPLGRAEWIKLAGILTGQFEAANEAFNTMKKRYEKAVIELSYNTDLEHPTVFTGSHSSGMWFAPPGNSYIGQFIADAGGKYLFADYHQRGNVELQFEELIDRAYDVDYWGKVVYEEGDLTLESIRANDERYANLKAFKSGQVFYCNAAETDYFGDAIVEPGVILEDLIAILHPELNPGHRFTYFKPIEP